MTVTVRPMERADLAEVARLCAQLGFPADEAALVPRFAALAGDGLFVAEIAARIVGWIHVGERVLLESEARAELGGLVVDERARRAGVGRALVERAIAWARARSLRTLRLRSNVNRPEAHAFYPALGFRLTKTQHAYERSVDPA
jgi:GNAT superfamily N-acetyltransferase